MKKPVFSAFVGASHRSLASSWRPMDGVGEWQNCLCWWSRSERHEAVTHENAGRTDFKQTAMGTLVLIILLDQFSRNIFRGSAGAFANDAKARSLAEYALKHRFDKNTLTVQRLFFYLPFEHAEDLELQEKSVALFVNLGDASSLQHALCHRDQIVRFGRFPDRNKALDRRSTKAEEEFLKNPFC
jgi:uncharacterized protein (DUF924 family)